MTDRGDNAPPPEGWATDARCCPFANCWACTPDEGFGIYPLPESIVLGEN